MEKSEGKESFQQPKNITIQETANRFILVQKHFHFGYVILAVLLTIATLLFAYWFKPLLFGEYFEEIRIGVFSFGRGDAHIVSYAIGGILIFLSYTTLSGFVNSTCVEIDSDFVRIKTKPLPPFRNKKVHRSELNRFVIKEITVSGNTSRNKSRYYKLAILKKNGQSENILETTYTEEELEYIKNELHGYLNI